MLSLSAFDIEELAMALAQQDTYELAWLVDPATGQTVVWTADTGIDGNNPVELDELDHLVMVEPLPSRVWFRDMVDFVDGISDDRAGRRLGRALEGRHPFRSFRDALYRGPEEHLIGAWHAFRNARAEHRAVEWLLDNELVSATDAQAFLAEHPEPGLP